MQNYRHEILIDPPYDENINGNNNYSPAFDYGRAKGDEPPTLVTPVDVTKAIPETEIIQHAPGWTIFKNLYMSSGTFYVVSDKPRSEFPELLYILSVPIPALDTPENIRARLPTNEQMDFISAKDAQRRWGPVKPGERNRIWTITGNTVRVSCDFQLFSCFPLSARAFFPPSLQFHCFRGRDLN